LTMEKKEGEMEVAIDGRCFQFKVRDETRRALEKAGGTRPKKKGPPVIKAEIPGVVVGVMVSVGQEVQKGDILLVVEAMKMQNEILAPADGVVTKVSVEKAQLLGDGDALVSLDYN